MASVNDGGGGGETPRSVLHRAGSEWTALDLNESGDEADERTPLITAGLPDQSPRFRRSSLYGGRPELNPNRKASWAELMKEAESLDTDVLINVVSIEERRMQDKPKEDRPFIKKSKKRGLIKWMFNALIGIMVGITAFTVEKSIDMITEARQELMWRVMMDRTDYRNQCSPWSTETWSKEIWEAAGYPVAEATRLAAQPRGGIHCLLNPAFLCHFAISLSCVLATVCMIVAFGPAASGSGVSLVMAYLNGLHVPKLLSAKTLVCKVIGTILTVASGLPLGPEGPLVHIGAGIASFFTRQHSFKIFGVQIGRKQGDHSSNSKSDFDMFNNDFDRREFISSGAAVGLAAAFGAPIGGVLYALEETSSFWSQRVTWRAILCTTLGTFTLALFQGHGRTVGAAGLLSFAGQPNAYFVWELIPFVVIAMCGGSAGALFVAIYKRAERYRRTSKFGKLCEATVVVLIVACVSFWVPTFGGRCIPRPHDMCSVDCSRVCIPCLLLLATSVRLELSCLLCCTPAQCTSEGQCDQSEVGRCLWLRNASSPMKGVCQGPNDELTLLTSNCPCGRASDRHYETETGQQTGSSCPFYNDLATLFLGDREGVISQLMRMRGHTFNATLLSGDQCSPEFERDDTAGVIGPRFTERSLVLFLLLNFCCLILAFGISVPSGLFMPSIMTGAAFGGLLGIQLRKFVLANNTGCWIMAVEDFNHHLVPGLYALVGSAAMLAGVFRSSISLAVILLEGTGQIQYLLPILLTIGVAKITADIFVDGLNEVQLDLKDMPFLHREPSRGMALLTAADAMTSNVQKFRAVERAGVLENVLQNCSHNGFPVCTVVKDPTTKEERWLFDGMILRSQLLVILSRRVLTDPDGGGLPELQGDLAHGRLKTLSSLEQMIEIDQAMRQYHHRHNFYSRSVSSDAQKVAHIGLTNAERLAFADLSPYINLAPLTVRDCCPLGRVFTHFRTMGLRHAVVVDRHNAVVGIITRKDLAKLQHQHHSSPRARSNDAGSPGATRH